MAEVNEVTGRLAELVKQVQAGDEILLTQGHKPVAKIISASEPEITRNASLSIHSLKGHRVLVPTVSQSDLANEIFGGQ